MIYVIFHFERSSVKTVFKTLLRVLSVSAIGSVFFVNAEAAKLSPALKYQLASLANNASAGVEIVSRATLANKLKTFRQLFSTGG